MKIIREENGRGGVFQAIEDGRRIGEMSYFWKDDHTFAIDHTGVVTSFEGRGVGKGMVNAAVKFARENDYKIVPICPFVAAMFKRDPSIRDVEA